MKSSRSLPENIRAMFELPLNLRDAILGIPFPADMIFDIRWAMEKGILGVYESLYADRIVWIKTNYKIGRKTFSDWGEFNFGPETSRDKMHEMVQECVSGLEARKDAVAAGADYRNPIQKTFDAAFKKFQEYYGVKPTGAFMKELFKNAPN